jgi:hypothetical protein
LCPPSEAEESEPPGFIIIKVAIAPTDKRTAVGFTPVRRLINSSYDLGHLTLNAMHDFRKCESVIAVPSSTADSDSISISSAPYLSVLGHSPYFLFMSFSYYKLRPGETHSIKPISFQYKLEWNVLIFFGVYKNVLFFHKQEADKPFS